MLMFFAARRPTSSTKGRANSHFVRKSGLGHEPIEHFEKRIDNRLARRVGGFSDLLVGHVTGGKCQIATFVSNDGARPFDRPLAEVIAVLDGHRFGRGLVGNLRFLLEWRCSYVVAR